MGPLNRAEQQRRLRSEIPALRSPSAGPGTPHTLIRAATTIPKAALHFPKLLAHPDLPGKPAANSITLSCQLADSTLQLSPQRAGGISHNNRDDQCFA